MPLVHCLRLEEGKELEVGMIQLSLVEHKKKANLAISLNIDYKLSLLLTLAQTQPARAPPHEQRRPVRRVHASLENSQPENELDRKAFTIKVKSDIKSFNAELPFVP